MNDNSGTLELLSFFKALADENRLRIIGLLAVERRAVEQLAAILNLRPSTVSHHLSKLENAKLVTAKAEGYYSVYQLESGVLESMAQRLLSSDTLPDFAANLDLDAYDQQVLKNFSSADGRLKTIPAQRRKRQAILRVLTRLFEVDRTYTEREVNQLLSRYHADTATLRRELITEGLLERDAGQYWRSPV